MRIANRGLALAIGLAVAAPIASAQTTSSIPSTTSLHSTASAGSTATPECVEGVYVIVARGSEEDVGQGEMAVVAEGVEDAIDGSEAVALDYPATFQAYGRSVADGVEALNETLMRYVEECPDGKVALMGFSQGANVALDALCGRDTSDADGINLMGFQDTDPVDQDVVLENVIAVVLFGDPTHTSNHSWNVGNSTQDGLFPRSNLSACDAYTDVVRSWCDEGDVYCDRGDNRATHRVYFEKYFDDAVEFVVERWDNVTNGSNSSSNGSTGGNGNGNGNGNGGNDGDDEAGSEDESEDGDSAAVSMRVGWGVLALAGIAGLAVL